MAAGGAIAVETLLRRLAGSVGTVPFLGRALRSGWQAALPLRRRIVGPRLDRRLEALARELAARPPARLDPARPLHVALLCAFGDQPTGGIAVWTRMLAAALVADGHRAELFHLARFHDAPYLRDGVRYVPVHAAPIRRWPDPPPLWPWLQDYLRGACHAVLTRHAEDPFDIVSGPIWLVEALPLIRTGAVRTAVSLHTSQSMELAKGTPQTGDAREEAYREALAAAERDVLLAAPIVIGNSDASSADILGASGIAPAEVPLSVVAHGMPDLSGKVAAEARPAGAPPGLLFVGRLGPRKGIDTFLEALSHLGTTTPFEAEIAGAPDTGDPEPAFRSRHEGAPWLSGVRFLGGVDDAAKWRLVAGADIVVVPSRYESFGLVAVEAMMFGKPVVSTRVGGIPEVVQDGVTGLLVAPGDAEALAAALRRLCEDPALRERMGAAGRARYLERFTDRAMAKAWVAAIRDGLARLDAARRPRGGDPLPVAATRP